MGKNLKMVNLTIHMSNILNGTGIRNLIIGKKKKKKKRFSNANDGIMINLI